MKKFFKILVIILLVGMLIATFVFLYSKSKKKPEIYNVETVRIDNVIKKTVATGSVVPRKEIEIKPQVSGIVDELYLEAGQMVRTGDVIAKIKIIPDMVTLNSAESRLNIAKLNYEDSKVDYDRQQGLYEKKVIAFEQYQKSQLAYNKAREELESAQNNLDLIRKGVTQKAAAQSNTLIRSTIDGMILDVPVEVGNSVIQTNNFNEGTTIAIVADMNDMIFEGKVDESEVGKIHEGMDIILTVGAIDEQQFDAVLTYLAPKGVIENGAIQFEVKADVQLKSDQFLRSGYSANASIVLDRRDSVMVIREGLIKFEDDKSYVEIEVDSQKFEKRYIETGLSDGLNIEVLDGIGMTEKIKADKK